jgi:phosphotransferase system HPr (HPr) family protein
MSNASRQIVVTNELGLHARPAMQFVDMANLFTSAVTVRRLAPPEVIVDGKSVMEMITLEATKGTPLSIEARGDDAELAVENLAQLFASNFGEQDK